mmetsp:Transcript_36978/g.93390  ORF Transcript_36978/g.93390 Transcript_36978/m.93390 type:complete len:135 (-) Transcript_36978:814-1218(-)
MPRSSAQPATKAASSPAPSAVRSAAQQCLTRTIASAAASSPLGTFSKRSIRTAASPQCPQPGAHRQERVPSQLDTRHSRPAERADAAWRATVDSHCAGEGVAAECSLPVDAFLCRQAPLLLPGAKRADPALRAH